MHNQSQMYWSKHPKNDSHSVENYFLYKNRNKINPYKYHYTQKIGQTIILTHKCWMSYTTPITVQNIRKKKLHVL